MAITLKTDKQGLAIVDKARVTKNWTALALAWCERANVSLSTLKRFRERKAIQKDAFIAICQAVGIENWQQVIAGGQNEAAILMRRYRQSKRVIAEEVLSNLNSLDARLDFVAQAFSDDPIEAQRQLERWNVVHNSDPELDTYHHAQLSPKSSQPSQAQQSSETHPNGHAIKLTAPERPLDFQPTNFQQSVITIEANVSIIQILMEI